MLPVIALVGRPNVGKSTLFNYLTRSREALVADMPGLTRDRQYGRVKHGIRPCLVVDTGGIADDAEGIESFSRKQVQVALEEADVVLFMVDAREGLSASDKAIAETLRKMAKPIILVTNKIDGLDAAIAASDFYSLALGEPSQIAASHGRGVPELLERVNQLLPPASALVDDEGERKGVGIAVVGRPNVGKSTLVNRLLGEERVIVFDQPGTTRDSIYIPFERNGKQFTLIDTAGMRRRSKIAETIEKFSVIKSLQAIEKAHVVIYLIDASEGVTDQDAHLLGLVIEAGRALIIGLNKWDGLDHAQKETVKRQLEVKLSFMEFAEKHPISALHGSGVGKLFDVVNTLYESAMINMSTPVLTRILKEATDAHQPPMVNNRRIKLKYAHQGGRNPPVVIVHGVQTDALPISYKRYLTNYYREQLKLSGTPIRLEFKSPANPFSEQKKKQVDWQVQRREKILQRVKNKQKG
ncbi:ribosome biogenesis GTPase Der [Methylovulum psychrotolerans]|jgi:GTP-binding protein|uniref:GTPase Der n=1 Tax=Methylovulum psychrotolerans TaxID=1704499 RepID=A0A2S5CJR1_9GAMM|nr:ribosome biogenesis GTPase Der [Methylovulum psychrotolerans]MBT9098995.1 ribosome biogenesis GTPase Der [Methylovulum psychrotolerans]POZ50982.1 ribosome biogenesis GTPase Der [Methylovulum psychrotolerans]